MANLPYNLANEETFAKKDVLEADCHRTKKSRELVNRKRLQCRHDFGAFSIYFVIGRLQEK